MTAWDCLKRKEYNSNRSNDFMVALRYLPASEPDDNGISEHEDGNCLTFVLQDNVGGLEVLKDGVWIPANPEEGTIIVNDIIQVESANKHGSLLEVIQVLTDLNLTISRANISSDGGWFFDDGYGNKLSDVKVIDRIQEETKKLKHAVEKGISKIEVNLRS